MKIRRFVYFPVVLAFFLGMFAYADTLSGIISTEDGTPVANAAVWLNQQGAVATTKTDAKGEYGFDDIIVGASNLVARHADFALAGRTMFLVGSATTDLVMRTSKAVTLRIIGETFAPVAGARVTWMDVGGEFLVPNVLLNEAGFPAMRSNDEGMLTIDQLPEGGFVRIRLTHFRYADTTVDYLPVDGKIQEVVLLEGHPVRGRVMIDDRGIEDAMVRIFQVGVGGQKDFASGLSDVDGFYSLRATDGVYFVAAGHRDYASPPPQEITVGDDALPAVDFTLLVPRVIDGSIVLADGKPGPGVHVAYRVEDTVYEETYSDGSGKFTIKAPSPDGVLRVTPPAGYLTETLADIPVHMDDALAVTLPPIRLEPLPRISGFIYDTDNKPLRDAIISSTSLASPVWAIPDENGHFEIQLQFAPEETQVSFNVEHSLRFQRGAFTDNIRKSREHKVYLKPFEPNVAVNDGLPGLNDLGTLLGEVAPDLNCREWFNGDAVNLKSLIGKVVVMVFWGGFDNSPMGIDQIEELRAIHRLYEPTGDVAVLGIHDSTSDPEEVALYIRQRGILFPVGLDGNRLETFDAYSINYIPQVVLIDKKGVVRFTQTVGRLPEIIKALRRE